MAKQNVHVTDNVKLEGFQAILNLVSLDILYRLSLTLRLLTR